MLRKPKTGEVWFWDTEALEKGSPGHLAIIIGVMGKVVYVNVEPAAQFFDQPSVQALTVEADNLFWFMNNHTYIGELA